MAANAHLTGHSFFLACRVQEQPRPLVLVAKPPAPHLVDLSATVSRSRRLQPPPFGEPPHRAFPSPFRCSSVVMIPYWFCRPDRSALSTSPPTAVIAPPWTPMSSAPPPPLSFDPRGSSQGCRPDAPRFREPHSALVLTFRPMVACHWPRLCCGHERGLRAGVHPRVALAARPWAGLATRGPRGPAAWLLCGQAVAS
jgi:hypothetical protein